MLKAAYSQPSDSRVLYKHCQYLANSFTTQSLTRQLQLSAGRRLLPEISCQKTLFFVPQMYGLLAKKKRRNFELVLEF